MPFVFFMFALIMIAIVYGVTATTKRSGAAAAITSLPRGRVSMSTVPQDTCLRCHSPMTSVGVEHFRVGGTTGGWKLLFGEWAEVGEGMLDLEILACTKCRRVELRIPPR